MIGLLLLSAFGYPYMRQGFFPDMVYDQLYMEYKLPEGNNHTRVAQDLKEIETYLKGRKEITHVTTSIGGTPGRYNLCLLYTSTFIKCRNNLSVFKSMRITARKHCKLKRHLLSDHPSISFIHSLQNKYKSQTFQLYFLVDI